MPDRRFPPPEVDNFSPRLRHTVGTKIHVRCGDGHMKTAAHHRIIGAGKLLTNERTNPYLVEIPVAAAGLDIALNRQIVEFHKSRHIQLRHGRSILRYGETYYRWCFRDSTTARAFVEQFGGALHTHAR